MRWMRRFSFVLMSALSVCAILAVPSTVTALVSSIRGELPHDWPEELLSNRKNAKTIEVAHLIQENAYEIRFKDRAKFERAWPHIVALKDKGAPIILESGTSTYSRSGTTLNGPGVRVLAPVAGRPSGRSDFGPPWPDYLKSAEGVIPEYISLSDQSRSDRKRLLPPMWEAWDPNDERFGFVFRARVDVMLVVDGDIVDLNRIKLPADTPIIDNRVLPPPE